ncbi:type III restriction protein res subunit [Thermocrinis albus DSM 14484]|uniref:Type III restriction protein res subunit n=1 Tax=Thermocrinis albus (strain DSM 14484 / JCM 11386 / HI 11/12) TaxID=638303 RepID=D3SMD7_THEAH|nr:DEAD/DEAH box helicase family protein [Thermocrinis albus]ADC89917.1 type III restriction protein res subunit [Thermocrinis albus DSM 14484]
MVRLILQNMVKDINFSHLPSNWNSFDLESFSKEKKLWSFQQKALENAIKALWLYYEDIKDYSDGEDLSQNKERKRLLFERYKNNGLEEDFDIKDGRTNKRIYELLKDYYQEENGKIPYWNFINRMSFWMATGSGKTLVIIKLIHILMELMERKEIPECDILFLSHRDDLISQFKKHVEEANRSNNIKIELRELKEYEDIKRSLFGTKSVVFYYRSDLIGDEQREKIIDFRNYDNGGRWYIVLDEAHKGDKEESKSQHIYSILSRNGFLFNFSATFTDIRDIITTVFEFNLGSFIQEGYGKHISILKQEVRAFKEKEDYNEDEKQKIVLKALIILTYTKKFYEKLKPLNLYHNPLLLVLVNSVNTEDSDLKLFFRELERIGRGEISDDVFHQAKTELWNEIKEEPEFIYEDGEKFKASENDFNSITKDDILKYVYNAESFGEIEVLRRKGEKKELAFKLKTSDKPFALIKIGDTLEWLKGFSGYEVQESFQDESYFESLNRDDSSINILMGSRAFYEGWDSNRPNVILFINIGVGVDAKKFVLQSIGRGVRIEPMKNKRRRLLFLYNSGEIDEDLFNKVKDNILPLETLFIFGTNRNALETVIKELKSEKKEASISLYKNEDAINGKLLLIPKYKKAGYLLVEKREPPKFEISKEELDLVKKYVNSIDDRILLMLYNTEPKKIKFLKESFNYEEKYYKKNGREYKNPDLLIQRIFDYFSVIPEEVDKLKELEDEIRHFKNIKVYLEDIENLKDKIEKVKNYESEKKQIEESNLSDELKRKLLRSLNKEDFEHGGKRINIKYILNHYYIPVILSEDEKIDYIKHIIKTKSEVDFINELEKYLDREDNKFKNFDWWLFSKIDESLDEVYIPYYDPNTNSRRNFYPDFIFWLKKSNNYFIVFIDPKGTKHTDYEHKVDGYKKLFEENGKKKVFNYNGLSVSVWLFLKTDDVNRLSEGYREYWFDDMGKVLEKVSSWQY